MPRVRPAVPQYDYRTGKEKRKHKPHKDASGRDEPYDPDWGNYGARYHRSPSCPCSVLPPQP